MDKVAIILSAGKSTRMKSEKPKALHLLMGKPVISHIIDNCRKAGFQRVIVVIGWKGEKIREALGDDVEYVEQKKPQGTGDALRVTKEHLKDFQGTALVIYGDVTLVPPEVISQMLEHHLRTDAQCTLLTADLPDHPYGKIIKDEKGRVAQIFEPRGREVIPPEIEQIEEVNAGVYLFSLPLVFSYLDRLNRDNPQGEYYLTDVVELLYKDGHNTQAVKAPENWMAKGINDRRDLMEVGRIMRRNILESLMKEGVTIIEPDSTFIEASVEIGQDTIIHPFTFIKGRTKIASSCEIGPFAYIENSEIGEESKVVASFVRDSKIGKNCSIGPFAHIRPGTVLKEGVQIGDFVEVKNSILESGVKAMHLAYLGDAFVGEGTNIGAGTITCNFDGEKKNKTTIGKEVFVGSDAILVAPVEIGDKAYIAAGSVITRNVPPYALGIARQRQENKEEWVKKRKARKKGEEDAK